MFKLLQRLCKRDLCKINRSLDSAKLNNFQVKRLKTLLENSYNKANYYRNIFKEASQYQIIQGGIDRIQIRVKSNRYLTG